MLTNELTIDDIHIHENGNVVVVELNVVTQQLERTRQILVPPSTPLEPDPDPAPDPELDLEGDPEPEPNPEPELEPIPQPPTYITETYTEVREISRGFNRKTISPGQDYSQEHPRVQAICAVVHTEEYLGIPIHPLDAAADWDMFNASILSDVTFNTYYGQGLMSAPAVTTSLPTALSQVAINGVASFQLVFQGFCQAVQVSTEAREAWAQMAVAASLPPSFVSILRGS